MIAPLPPPGSEDWYEWAQWLHGAVRETTEGTINVRAHGATGDGTTDDTAAIQAAIDAAQAHGGEVHFPAGVYRTTAPLNVTALVALSGTGDGSTIKAGAAMPAVLTVDGAARHTFTGLRFEGADLATHCVRQTVAVETSVGSRWVRCKFTGATDYQMVNDKCEDVTYLDCATDGDMSQPGTVRRALQVYVPDGAVRIIGGEWFGRCAFNMQQVGVYGAVIGPVYIDNPAGRRDSILRLDSCYVYDGGVDTDNCIGTGTNLCNIHLSACYLVPAVLTNYVNGHMPGVSIRFLDCTFVEEPELGAAPACYAVQASGEGRVIVDGGTSVLNGGTLHPFNPVGGATVTVTTQLPCIGMS